MTATNAAATATLKTVSRSPAPNVVARIVAVEHRHAQVSPRFDRRSQARAADGGWGQELVIP
eukprot:scaffold105659_cov66-Phaeocystis_antarctica.AAC.1